VGKGVAIETAIAAVAVAAIAAIAVVVRDSQVLG
jgi:hypothetical protein